MSELSEIVDEFVVESLEGLDLVDGELLKLESNPEDEQTLQSIFRTVHSMKGACGFLEFNVLESVAHAGENLLDALRERKIALDKGLITTLLEMNDAIRSLLGTIQETGADVRGGDFGPLVSRLHACLEGAAEGGAPVEPSSEDLEPQQTQSAASEEATDESESIPEPELPSEPTGQPGTASAPTPESTPTKPSPKAAGDTGAQAAKSASESSIRLRVEQLDALMNLAGELVLARNQVVQKSSEVEDSAAHATAQRLSRITTELQEGIMKIRMQPIGTLWSKLPRVVRGMSMQLQKEVELKMLGSETEVDKTLLEAIKDPLTHLVRNSLDHGIEAPEQREAVGKPRMATLTLSAFHESGQVNIVVRDDGRGIDPEAIKAKAIERGLITSHDAQGMEDRAALEILFMPGFSTAEQVTSISGRGVGMDVVKRNLECVGGTVEIESELGVGTEVVVRIPLTLAIIPALTVHSGGNRYAIPQANLVELLRVGPDSALGIEEVFGQRVFRLRGDLLHLVDLNRQLGTTSTNEDQECSIVVVQASGRSFGLVVDGIYESEEIVVKPLDRVVKSLQAYAGTTILADGQVALILDIAGLAQRAQLMSEDELQRAARQGGRSSLDAGVRDAEPVEFLVASVGGDRRIAMELSLVDRLEEVESANVETAGSLRFIQYRDELLQLIDVGRTMGAADSADPSRRIWKTIVRSQGGASFGLVVDDVLDIIEVPASERPHPSPDSAISSVLVVGGRVTEVIDEAWVASSFQSLTGHSSSVDDPGSRPEGDARVLEPQFNAPLVQLCTFRLGHTLYGLNVLDVQEVLMPLQRTPIPLSPPEVEGLLNLRGDTVLSVDLAVLLGVPDAGATRERSIEGEVNSDLTDRMNVVLRSSQGSFSMLVDEVGEVMELPKELFEPCPSTVSPIQRKVAAGVFKLENDLLIHLDVEQLHALVAESQLLARA